MDGRYTDLEWDGGQCAASNYEQTVEWRVGLGAVRSIHHIVIQYGTGNEVGGTVCFNVQLNNLLMFNWL